MSRVVFSMTENQWEILAAVHTQTELPWRHAGWKTVRELIRRKWIARLDGEENSYGATDGAEYRLLPVGERIVALARAIEGEAASARAGERASVSSASGSSGREVGA